MLFPYFSQLHLIISLGDFSLQQRHKHYDYEQDHRQRRRIAHIVQFESLGVQQILQNRRVIARPPPVIMNTKPNMPVNTLMMFSMITTGASDAEAEA